MKTKALFIDLDGTLLTDNKKITPENYEAIHEALDAGHKIILSTGRPLVSAEKQAEALDLTREGCYLISYNGAVLYDVYRRRVLARKTVPLPSVYTTFDYCRSSGIHIQTYSDSEVLVEPCCDDQEVRDYCSLILMEYRVIPEIRTLKREPVKMLAMDLDETGALDRLISWIAENEGEAIDCYYSNPWYLEIVAKGMNKGNAIRSAAEYLGIPMEQTIAAGDGQNDLPMIEAAGLGVGMKNGIEAVKSAADYVTQADNNHHAIAEIIRKFVLNS